MVMPPKGIFQNELSFSYLDVSCNLITMFVAMVFCTEKRTNVLHYKNIWMKKLNTKLTSTTLQNFALIVLRLEIFLCPAFQKL